MASKLTHDSSSTSTVARSDNAFEWLDSDARGPEYVSYSQLADLPACSFDFGYDGYAASSNYGGELLQMTAPSDQHGLIFARGDFEYSLYLALARGQKEKGGKSAFGLKIETSDQFATKPDARRYRPCCMVERGCFNYRWPFNEFCIHVDKPPSSAPKDEKTSKDETHEAHCVCPAGCSNDPTGENNTGIQPAGTLSLLSFIRDGVLYQLLRLGPQCQTSGENGKAELLLTVEPPMRLQSFGQLNQNDSKDKEVALRGCSRDACLWGRLCGTKIHWQAHLFKLDTKGDKIKPVPVSLTRLSVKMEKKDHCFKVNDDLDSLPRYQAKLDPLDISSSHVFVASFRISEREETGSETDERVSSVLSHTAILDFVRKGEPQEPGTAAMWQAFFNDRQDKMKCVSQLCEPSVVGRCLEKIIGVDLVPATLPGASPRKHLALVSNMFLKANVDLKSLFWKTRFLAKIDQLLCEIIKEKARGFPSQSEYNQPMSEAREGERWCKGFSEDMITAEVTVCRIRYLIGEIMEYIVRALLKPSPSLPVLLPEKSRGGPNHYYAMMTIYYVVKQYPKASWSWQSELEQRDAENRSDDNHGATPAEDLPGKGWEFGILGDRLPSKRDHPPLWSSYTVARVKCSMLKWFHYESIWSLQTDGELSKVIPAQWHVGDDVIRQVRRAAKTELLRRIASGLPYGSDDEIIDRLAFLADELWGSPQNAASDTVDHLTTRIVRRIEEREDSRAINLCHTNSGKEGSDDGPWEVHALCHHSRLVVAHRKLQDGQTRFCRDEVEMEIEHYRSRFYPFLTSEASLTPCWERNNTFARRGFLRSETTAVLASTILNIFLKDLNYQKSPNPASSIRSAPSIETDASSDSGLSGTSDHGVRSFKRQSNAASLRRLKQTGRPGNTRSIMEEQLETLQRLAGARGVENHLDYLQFRPPQRYHPEEFFNSLDDTSDIYDDSAIKERERSVPLAIIEGLRSTNPDIPGPYSGSIREAGDLAAFIGPVPETEQPYRDLIYELTADVDTTIRLRELLVGKEQGISKNSDAPKAATLLRELSVIDLITPDAFPSNKPKPILGKGGKEIVRVVSDSLIDQEVRHRFLLAETPYELKPGLLRLFVHVLHPEIVECFKNHALRVPRFGLWTRQETVILHITLKSWTLTNENGSFVSTKEDERIYLPKDMRTWLTKYNSSDSTARRGRKEHGSRKEERNPHDMELKVASIGMSTNEFGDFSKCSIITDLIDKDDIRTLGERAQEIWDGFNHQPRTGRLIVFSLVLRLLCRGIVSHYTRLIDDFLKQTQLETQLPSYLESAEKLQERDADAELRFSLWSLEALNKLSNTVGTSVQTINQAITGINEGIQGCPGKRSPELENVCRNHLDMLKTSFSSLTAIQTKLEQKVELNTRHSSALSAVLSLRASRDSFTQNNTIQKLTYITIGCLPIALTAAIFAVPTEQDVIPKHTGQRWFIGTVFITFVVIFCIAYFLDSLLRYLRMVRDDTKTVLTWSRNGKLA